MNQQPDKLFRDKLEGYQKSAPASAWEKIAAAQSKKNDKWLWLKVAVSIAFVAAAGYTLFPERKTSDLSNESLTKPAEEKTIEHTTPPAEKSDEDVKTEMATPSATPNRGSTHIAKRTKPVETIRPSKEERQRVTVVEERPSQEEPTAAQPEVNENVASTETVDQPRIEATPIKTEVAPNNSITLTYTAKDVEEYLDKKALAEATSDNKKSSTFKKLLKKAEDLTNNQDPFGELRQKKNEILALNFKNEKQRGQNK